MIEARKYDLVIRLLYQPGDFVHAGRALAEAWPSHRCATEAEEALCRAFSLGSRRTALQDLRFLIDELVEIAGRALSPGINDPFTAVTCLDWLGAALSEIAARDIPNPLRRDDTGKVRVLAQPVTLEGFTNRGFGVLAQYCAGDMVAAMAFIRVLGEVCLGCDEPAKLKLMIAYVDKLEGLARSKLAGFNLDCVSKRADELRRAVSTATRGGRAP